MRDPVELAVALALPLDEVLRDEASAPRIRPSERDTHLGVRGGILRRRKREELSCLLVPLLDDLDLGPDIPLLDVVDLVWQRILLRPRQDNLEVRSPQRALMTDLLVKVVLSVLLRAHSRFLVVVPREAFVVNATLAPARFVSNTRELAR